MAPEQAIGELRALAEAARRCDTPRHEIAFSLQRLADRMEGLDPLPRARCEVNYINGRRVIVQRVRGHFGL